MPSPAEENPTEPSSVAWLDTELFGPLPLPADPALRTDTEAILARARALASRSKATETLRSYRTCWKQWCGFCRHEGILRQGRAGRSRQSAHLRRAVVAG